VEGETEAREREAPPVAGVQGRKRRRAENFIHGTGVVTQTGAGAM